jgi:hypothetical protein
MPDYAAARRVRVIVVTELGLATVFVRLQSHRNQANPHSKMLSPGVVLARFAGQG